MSSIFFVFFLFSTLILCTLSNELIFCPRPIDEGECPLKSKSNECCSQNDCRSGHLCCTEPCGNVCRVPSDEKMGQMFEEGTKCHLGKEHKHWWSGLFSRSEILKMSGDTIL
uniref:Putative neurotoxin LTDF 13-01 n=1 Tax=Dolomedes fimbriatus TaxID=1432569 RepID=A0A0K1D8W9_9ARAC|nr:putative neurotoxin LTDF 13-01 [Dolomedes fimbriatus]